MPGVVIARRDLLLESPIGPLEIVRLSPIGLSFFPPLGVTAPAGTPISVFLPLQARPLVALVGPTTPDGEQTAEFVDLDLDRARDIARLIEALIAQGRDLRKRPTPLELDRIVAPERIREVLHTLFSNRCRGRILSPSSADRPVRVGAGRIEPHSKTPLQWECEEQWPPPPFTISIDGEISRVSFRVDVAAEIDGFLAVAVPEEIVRERARVMRRVPAPDDVILGFSHPRWPKLKIRRRARDLSIDGMRIVGSAVKDLLYPGLELPEATITWKDRLLCRVAARVSHVTDDVDGEAQIIGLSLRFAHEDEHTHWREQLGGLLHPNTRSDGTWSNQLWELYRSSGYLELSNKSESEFVALKQAFADTSARIARSNLGVQVVWPSSRGLESSMSILRCYEHGAFIYQLARRQGRVPLRFPGRGILRDVYLHAIEELQRWKEVRWLIAWVQKDARFSRLVHVDMPRRYAEGGRTLLWRFRAFEADVAPTLAPPAPGALELGLATLGEVAQLIAHVQATRSPHYIEAFDLSAEAFDQRGLRSSWTQAKLHRERTVLVARRGGRAVAAVLCEAADDGLHLFRLLDVVRLYALVPGGEASFPSLLDEARRFYAALGKLRFICFAELDDIPHLGPAGLRDLGEADAVLLPSGLLPELLEHIFEITAPRDVPRLSAP